jgi:hypothetical protein
MPDDDVSLKPKHVAGNKTGANSVPVDRLHFPLSVHPTSKRDAIDKDLNSKTSTFNKNCVCWVRCLSSGQRKTTYATFLGAVIKNPTLTVMD